jgi:hypothetical protein
VWHVDDLKISHHDEAIVKQVVANLNTEFGKHLPLKATFGKVHDYLGMTLDYSQPGKVMVKMPDYTDKILKDLS